LVWVTVFGQLQFFPARVDFGEVNTSDADHPKQGIKAGCKIASGLMRIYK